VTANSLAGLNSDSLSLVPLGGQSELGQMLWAIVQNDEILLIDAGASYPSEGLPGVDLLFPNTAFLEANREKIKALLLTNGHEEHCGAVSYLLRHLNIPRIMAPQFVSAFLNQAKLDTISGSLAIDTIEMRQVYQIGSYAIEWIKVNDAVADACALRIGTDQGNIVYTSSFKFDQTPVDKCLLDISRLAQIGESGVLLLISASAGAENHGYTSSEKLARLSLEANIGNAKGRVIVVMSGTNTHRLKGLFDTAKRLGRRILLEGELLIRSAISAAVTGNLDYDRQIEAEYSDLDNLADEKVLIVASGTEGDPMEVLLDLSSGTGNITIKENDLIIFSSELPPGRSRQMAKILDQFLSQRIKVVYGDNEHVHVPKHASREELKLMLSLTRPKYFIPAFGEGRHIMHHAQLANDWGMAESNIFPLKNGEVLSINSNSASISGTIEAQPVYFNRDQGERVTMFSVKERLTLSSEGILTISLFIDREGTIIDEILIDAGASGFLGSLSWPETKQKLLNSIKEECKNAINEKTDPSNLNLNTRKSLDIDLLRQRVRDVTVKTIRSTLQARPAVQVIVQRLKDLPACST
jgi:beta-CASP RNase J family ribonuclease